MSGAFSGAPGISLPLQRDRRPQRPHSQELAVQMIRTSCPQPGGDWKKPKSPQVPGGQRKHTCRQNPRQLEPWSPTYGQNKAGLNRPAKGILDPRVEGGPLRRGQESEAVRQEARPLSLPGKGPPGTGLISRKLMAVSPHQGHRKYTYTDTHTQEFRNREGSWQLPGDPQCNPLFSNNTDKTAQRTLPFPSAESPQRHLICISHGSPSRSDSHCPFPKL